MSQSCAERLSAPNVWKLWVPQWDRGAEWTGYSGTERLSGPLIMCIENNQAEKLNLEQTEEDWLDRWTQYPLSREEHELPSNKALCVCAHSVVCQNCILSFALMCVFVGCSLHCLYVSVLFALVMFYSSVDSIRSVRSFMGLIMLAALFFPVSASVMSKCLLWPNKQRKDEYRRWSFKNETRSINTPAITDYRQRCCERQQNGNLWDYNFKVTVILLASKYSSILSIPAISLAFS